MHYRRKIYDDIFDQLHNFRNILIVYGPRQVGKTTLIENVLSHSNYKALKINADEPKYIDVLSSRDSDRLSQLVSGYDVLFIDEAQRVPEIGINLKILHDTFKHLKIIVTGSSSLDLAGKLKEPLTGRTRTYTLFPISVLELTEHYTPHEIERQLNDILIHGMYPNILNTQNAQEKSRILIELADAYLYKDVLAIASIKNPEKIKQLLVLLAHQVGSEVSYSELGKKLELTKETVQSYISLLEQSFVVFRLYGYSKNLRKEVTKMPKLYFYDLGMRNSLIRQLQHPDYRQDMGKLWENFCIVERMKRNHYTNQYAQSFFWRTYSGAELDYIEDFDGILNGFEFKYGRKSSRVPKSFAETYPNHKFLTVTPENFLSFTC